MATTDNFSTDLGLPVVPELRNPPELFEELLKIYVALRNVAVQLDNNTADGELGNIVELTTSQLYAAIADIRKDVKHILLQLTLLNLTVNWGQPGELGEVNPNAATFTTLATTDKFGANGATPSGKVALPAAATDAATTQALANTLRGLAITFGLGV